MIFTALQVRPVFEMNSKQEIQVFVRANHTRYLFPAIVACLLSPSWAQRVDIPPNYGAPAAGGYPAAPAPAPAPAPTYAAPPTTGYGVPAAGYGGAPVAGPPPGAPSPMTATPNWGTPVVTQPNAALAPGIQPFDPYAMPAGNPALPPTLGTGYPTAAPPGGLPAAPGWPFQTTAPNTAPPYGALPSQPYMQQNVLPQSLPPYNRLFQDSGFRYTWLYGQSGDELGMNVLELGTSAYFPKFLGGAGPLRVSPGFVVNWLDGPSPPVTQSLPARVYDAFIDFGYTPQLNQSISGDISFRMGIYSDFKTINSDSVRFTGTGIGIIRVTPASSLKLGITYLDRADIKILPALGLLWQPNPQTKWDIFFPRPKLSKYWTTNGNTEVWWYIGSEYGGGSWTAENINNHPGSNRFDINDIRVYFGIDWNNLNRYNGIFEVGYVFEREVFYVRDAPDQVLPIRDTIMLRAGLTF